MPSSIVRFAFFALSLASLAILPSPASALTSAETGCRDSIARAVSRYEATIQKAMVSCHSRRSGGTRSLDDNCNDSDEANAAAAAEAREEARSTIVAGCGSATSLLGGYETCPAPAATADDGGPTTGIDDFEDLSDCLTALTDAHVARLSDDAQGLPDERLLDPLRKCQDRLGKGSAKLVKTILSEMRRCQKGRDAAGGPAEFTCENLDLRGRIQKARAKFNDKVTPSCTFSPEVLAKLDACDNDVEGLIDCARTSSETRANTIIRNAYELSEEQTTTTTSTTTTLPGTGCGSTFPTCGGSCPAFTECVNTGSACSCESTTTGACAPATIIRTIRGKYGSTPSQTSLSTGWSGSAHDVEVPDRTGDVVDVECDENCENCEISMNVQAGNPASNCRCTSNPQTTCGVINGPDPGPCGQIDPTCRCYFGAPLPLESAGTPACVVNRIREDYSGTMNLRTGEWSDRIKLAAVVYLGLDKLHPCPTCEGDPVANDGVRGGTCTGGVSSGACDVNGDHATFGPTSWDCLPEAASNVSGTGLLINLNATPDTVSMTASLPCDTPAGSDCHCRTCSGNGNLGCSSDAECAAAGAGTCTVGGGAGVRLNMCTGFACAPSGQCASGPIDRFCDSNTMPDNRGFLPCNSNADCSSGTCSIVDVRRCFPDPITATGDPDPAVPTSGSLFCIAPTSNPAINLAAGLPGPGKLLLTFESDVRCRNNPDVEYEFPSGANCTTAGSTTTTTLLPLPECGDAEAPLCGGVCPIGQTCGANGSVCECTGLPLPSCDDATAPLCGGFCEDANKICQANGATCECQIPTLPQCANAAAPVCGGLCPTGELCTDVGGTCECGAPGVPPCGSALFPTCAGLCDVGSVCIAQGSSCGCVSSGLPTCATATTPLCAGTCAIGSLCQDVLGACQCVTLPIPPIPSLP